MERRAFLELTGLGALGLACGRGNPSEAAAEGSAVPQAPGPSAEGAADTAGAVAVHVDAGPPAAEPAPAFAMAPTPPGFRELGPWTGEGPGPVFVQLTLNINDFMRPELEAAAVRRWMAASQQRGLWPMELSFTGHVLQAFVDHDPALVEEIRTARPTIRQHYRMLKERHLLSTERDMYATDPATLALDRSHYGPAVLIQKTLGVTTREEGGVLSELLRRRWVTGPDSQALLDQHFDRLDRQDQVAHPDRIVAWALPDIDATDPREHIEVFLRIRRLERDMAAGARLDPAHLEEALTDLQRWSQIAKEMGFDLHAIDGLADLVPVDRLPDFAVGVIGVKPRDMQLASFRQRLAADAEDTRALMESCMRALAARTSTMPDIATELRAKLAALDPDKSYAIRLAWHASNDHTLEAWGYTMYGNRDGGRPPRPFPLTPANERPADQRQAIVAAADSILDSFAATPRCRVASLHNDTQWAPDNSPARGYPAVFGVDFSAVPDGLDAAAVDALARSEGLDVQTEGRGNARGKAGQRPRGGRGGGPGGRFPPRGANPR